MQFHCASCGREIVSRYDGRLMQRPGTLAIREVNAWLIHQECTNAWVEQYGYSWQYIDLKPRRVVEAGGR